MSDVKQYQQQAETGMQNAIEYLDEKLAHIRAGKANPKILDDIMVSYYGTMTPLNQVGTVTVPDARTIVITPWEKKIIKDIEKAIIDSPLGIMPENNGDLIRIGIPPLIDAVKKSVKADGTPEDVAKDAEAAIQKLHDKYISRCDELFAAKEKEILTV